MVTLDTSALLSLFDRRERNHHRMMEAVGKERGPFVVPAAILSEVFYFLEQRLNQSEIDIFLEDLSNHVYMVDCGEQDYQRIRTLVGRYSDLPLGFADAAVIACAERHGGKVATLDLRHFGVVAAEGTIQVLP